MTANQPKIKVGSERTSSARKAAAVQSAEAEAVELEGRRSYFRLRSSWSRWIIAWITALMISNVVLTVFVGAGKLNFIEY